MAVSFASLKGQVKKPFKVHNLFVDGGRPAGGTPTYPPIGINPTEPPTNTAEGGLYFDDDNHALYQYNGSTWEEVGTGVANNATFGGTVDVTGATTLSSVTVTGTITPGSTSSMTAGTGITTATGVVYSPRVYRLGNTIKTEIFVDLTGLNSGGADGDIIGKNSTANSHFGQVTAAVNGLIYRGQISCAETPAGGEPDIDVYSATEATGTEDAAVSGLTETALLLNAADWTQGMTKAFTGSLVADQYLYLVASGGVTDATYTAGQFVIELWGYV